MTSEEKSAAYQDLSSENCLSVGMTKCSTSSGAKRVDMETQASTANRRTES
jgi:hypothetical protein